MYTSQEHWESSHNPFIIFNKNATEMTRVITEFNLEKTALLARSTSVLNGTSYLQTLESITNAVKAYATHVGANIKLIEFHNAIQRDRDANTPVDAKIKAKNAEIFIQLKIMEQLLTISKILKKIYEYHEVPPVRSKQFKKINTIVTDALSFLSLKIKKGQTPVVLSPNINNICYRVQQLIAGLLKHKKNIKTISYYEKIYFNKIKELYKALNTALDAFDSFVMKIPLPPLPLRPLTGIRNYTTDFNNSKMDEIIKNQRQINAIIRDVFITPGIDAKTLGIKARRVIPVKKQIESLLMSDFLTITGYGLA